MKQKISTTIVALMLSVSAGHAVATGGHERERERERDYSPQASPPVTNIQSSPNAYGGNVGPTTVAPQQTFKGQVSGTNTQNGHVSGTNTGSFQNDGRQTTGVGVGVGVETRNSSQANGGEGGKGGAGGSANSSSGSYSGVDSRNSLGVSNTGNSPSHSSSSAQGGASSATGNGAGNATNISTNNVYKRVDVPALFMPTPPSNSPSAMGIKETFACGPLHQVVMTPVNGTQVGTFSRTEVPLGNDYAVVPVRDHRGDQVYYENRAFIENGETVHRRFGSQIVFFYALPNVSGASSFSIGFAGSNGGGNGGAGSSSAMQRPVVRAEIVSCELPGAYKLVQEKAVMGLTKDDLITALEKAKLATAVSVSVPHDRVERKIVPCKLEEFTDSSGKKMSMCRGNTSGQQTITKVVRETATGNAQSAVELK